MGQHIHLVKFDVTSSDGAGNGFNYEDGTFSPDEVREMIHALPWAEDLLGQRRYEFANQLARGVSTHDRSARDQTARK